MAKLDNNAILQRLRGRFGEDTLRNIMEPFGLLTLETDTTQLLDVLEFLKTDDELQFGYLTDITAVHYPDSEKEFAVVYHVHSLVNNVRIRIKVFLESAYPAIPTATVLWDGANWMERETYDFFGIQFIGTQIATSNFEFVQHITARSTNMVLRRSIRGVVHLVQLGSLHLPSAIDFEILTQSHKLMIEAARANDVDLAMSALDRIRSIRVSGQA